MSLEIQILSLLGGNIGQLWPYHAALMVLGVSFLFSGMLVSRYLKDKSWWLKVHKSLEILGGIFTVLGILIAFYMVSNTPVEHLRFVHSYVGLFTVIFVLLTLALGYLQFKYTSRIQMIKTIHRWSGRIAILLMFITIYLGLSLRGLI